MLIYNLCLKVIFKKSKIGVQTQRIILRPPPPPLFRRCLKFYAFFLPFPKHLSHPVLKIPIPTSGPEDIWRTLLRFAMMLIIIIMMLTIDEFVINLINKSINLTDSRL